MCVIELIKYRNADGRIEQKEYTRICENGVPGQTCPNTVIRDSGLRDLTAYTPPTGLYPEQPSVSYPSRLSTMANDGLSTRGPPSTIEVASTTDRAKKTGKKYMTRHPTERTSVLTNLFRGAKDKVREKRYRDNERPPAPEPPAATQPTDTSIGAPPPPPPQVSRQTFYSDKTIHPGQGFPPIDTSAANFNQSRARSGQRSESSPITYGYTPFRRKVPPVLHQSTEYPSHFLPPGMSPTDSQFSSFSPSRDSSPLNTGFGKAPPFASAYTTWQDRGTSPNTPLDTYPPSQDPGKQGRSSHGASQSQGKLDHRQDYYKYQHHRSVSDGQASLPSFARKGSMRSRTRTTGSKLAPEITQEPRDGSDEDEPPRNERRRRHRRSYRELEDEVADLKTQVAQLLNTQQRAGTEATSPTGTDRTVKPKTGSRSRYRSDPGEPAIKSASPTSGDRSEPAQEDITNLRKKLEALEAKLAATEISPASPSTPSFGDQNTPTTNRYAARVDDAEEEDDVEENVTDIDSAESTGSLPRTPSPPPRPRDRPASVHLDQPFRLAQRRMEKEAVSPREQPDSKKPSDVRKERMHQRAQDSRSTLQRSYSDRIASGSTRPTRRDDPSESTYRERPRESSHHRSSHHGSSHHGSRQSSRHRTRPESDSESTSYTVRRQSVHSGDESQSRRRRDRRDREELKKRGRNVWD